MKRTNLEIGLKDIPTVPTLTLDQTAVYFRRAGIQTSGVKIAAGIVQGVYPFGVYIDMDGNRNFEIYEKLLLAYLSERAM